MVGILLFLTGCIPFGALNSLLNSDYNFFGDTGDTGIMDTADPVDTGSETVEGPSNNFGLNSMYGWHLVFDGYFALQRDFATDSAGNPLDEEFNTFLLPNSSAWGFAASIAPQNQTVSDWVFGKDEEATGAEFALFGTDNALVSLQFAQDNGETSERFVWPLIRYTVFDEGGVVCHTSQVDLAARETGYLPSVSALESGMQLLVTMTIKTFGGTPQHSLGVYLREGKSSMMELYTIDNFLSGIGDDCGVEMLAETTTIDGFSFGKGFKDGNLRIQNLQGRVDDLIIFDRENLQFSIDHASFKDSQDAHDNSDGLHYKELEFAGSGTDGFAWWGFEKYSPNGNGGPGTESHNAVDLSPTQMNNNLFEFCFVDTNFATDCITEPSEESIELVQEMYRDYQNASWSDNTW